MLGNVEEKKAEQGKVEREQICGRGRKMQF